MLSALLLSSLALAAEWRSPPQDILDVLYAPRLPWVWTSPSGEHLLLADPVTYPPLAEVPHRDRLVRLDAPFKRAPTEIWKAKHRIQRWRGGWT